MATWTRERRRALIGALLSLVAVLALVLAVTDGREEPLAHGGVTQRSEREAIAPVERAATAAGCDLRGRYRNERSGSGGVVIEVARGVPEATRRQLAALTEDRANIDVRVRRRVRGAVAATASGHRLACPRPGARTFEAVQLFARTFAG